MYTQHILPCHCHVSLQVVPALLGLCARPLPTEFASAAYLVRDSWGMCAGPLLIECASAAYLVGDSRGMCAHFEALRWEVPVGAGPLAGQFHAGALILFHDLAQPKVLYSA